jgi:hypothetical protein
MDDASIDSMSADKLASFVKRLRDASTALKKDRDEQEQGKVLAIGKVTFTSCIVFYM